MGLPPLNGGGEPNEAVVRWWRASEKLPEEVVLAMVVVAAP